MSEEDELLLGTIAGVDIILSPEHYKKYKGTLNKQIEELEKKLQQKENIIKEVREYIKDNSTDKYLLKSFDIDVLLEILDKEVN